MIEGVVVAIVGALALFVPPAERLVAHRRAIPRAIDVSAELRIAYPLAAATPPLAQLVAAAEAALDRDELSRGIRRVSAAYDRA